jgi:hypothetical protein
MSNVAVIASVKDHYVSSPTVDDLYTGKTIAADLYHVRLTVSGFYDVILDAQMHHEGDVDVDL